MFTWLYILHKGPSTGFQKKYNDQFVPGSWYSTGENPEVPKRLRNLTLPGIKATVGVEEVRMAVNLEMALGLTQPPKTFLETCAALKKLEHVLSLNLHSHAEVSGFVTSWIVHTRIRPNDLYRWFGPKSRWCRSLCECDSYTELQYATKWQNKFIRFFEPQRSSMTGSSYRLRIDTMHGNGARRFAMNDGKLVFGRGAQDDWFAESDGEDTMVIDLDGQPLHFSALFDGRIYKSITEWVQKELEKIERNKETLFDIEKFPKKPTDLLYYLASWFFHHVVPMEEWERRLTIAAARGELDAKIGSFRRQIRRLCERLMTIGRIRDNEERLYFDTEVRKEAERHIASADEAPPELGMTLDDF